MSLDARTSIISERLGNVVESRNDTISRRVSTAVTPEVQVANTAAPVRAAPVNRSVTGKQSGLLQLSQSLDKASVGFQKFIDRENAKRIERETIEATEAANRANAQSQAEAFGLLDGAKSREWQEAYLRQSGINAANAKKRDMFLKYETEFDKDNDDINLFIQQNITPDLEGLDDPSFKSSYLTTLSDFESELRALNTKETQEQLTADSKRLLDEGMVDLFDNLGSTITIDDLDKAGSSFKEGQGHEWSEINSAAISAAVNYSMRNGGTPEIFDNLFFNKGRQGVGSLGFSSEYGEVILAAKKSATIQSRAEAARLNSQRRFAAKQGALAQVENGKIFSVSELNARVFDKDTNPNGDLDRADAEAILSAQKDRIKGVGDAAYESMFFQLETQAKYDPANFDIDGLFYDDGLKSSDQRSLAKTWREAMAKEGEDAGIDYLLKNDDQYAAYDGTELGLKAKKAHKEQVAQLMSAYFMAEDPAQKDEFLNQAINLSERRNEPMSILKDKLLSSNPKSPDFARNFQLYQDLKQKNYTMLEANMSDFDSAMFDYTEAMLGGGMDMEQVQLSLKDIWENQDAAKTALSSLPTADKVATVAKSKLSEDGGFLFFGGTDTDNMLEVQGDVEKLAITHLAMTQGNAGDSVDWAIERYKSTHRTVGGYSYHVDEIPMLDDEAIEAMEWRKAAWLGDEADMYRYVPQEKQGRQVTAFRLEHIKDGKPLVNEAGEFPVIRNPNKVKESWRLSQGTDPAAIDRKNRTARVIELHDRIEQLDKILSSPLINPANPDHRSPHLKGDLELYKRNYTTYKKALDALRDEDPDAYAIALEEMKDVEQNYESAINILKKVSTPTKTIFNALTSD